MVKWFRFNLTNFDKIVFFGKIRQPLTKLGTTKQVWQNVAQLDNFDKPCTTLTKLGSIQ
jgi:hypothetical protein